MHKYIIGFLVVLLAIGAIGCPFDSNGSGGKKAEPREFYITDYEITPVYHKCYILPDKPHIMEDTTNILQPGMGYSLEVNYFNDYDNTVWVAFEVIVDGERFSSAGSLVIDGLAEIVLFHITPYQIEAKQVEVDIWLEDEDGIKSEVFTFDVLVAGLSFPTTE